MATSRRQKALVIGLLLAFSVAAVLFRNRLGVDFWPPDRSTVGPNLLASVVQYGIVVAVGALVYSPLKGRVRGFFDRKHEKISVSHDELHAKLDLLAERVEDLHKKVS